MVRVSEPLCFVLSVYVEDARPDEIMTLVDIVKRANPDFWEFFPSLWISVVFLREDKCQALYEALNKKVREQMSSSEIGVGVAQGKLIVARSLFGRIKESPIGEALPESMKAARESVSGTAG